MVRSTTLLLVISLVGFLGCRPKAENVSATRETGTSKELAADPQVVKMLRDELKTHSSENKKVLGEFALKVNERLQTYYRSPETGIPRLRAVMKVAMVVADNPSPEQRVDEETRLKVAEASIALKRIPAWARADVYKGLGERGREGATPISSEQFFRIPEHGGGMYLVHLASFASLGYGFFNFAVGLTSGSGAARAAANTKGLGYLALGLFGEMLVAAMHERQHMMIFEEGDYVVFKDRGRLPSEDFGSDPFQLW